MPNIYLETKASLLLIYDFQMYPNNLIWIELIEQNYRPYTVVNKIL